ncbi:hypothetical protein [Streptomyces sp. NRRL S-1868]|uniref:hypothetical protein n=1 Tax=Streptomyces sp. NRRL S-1868 TaxID=1463892 RepID=UPI0004C7C7C8|nr:hypothetical protein [Streptomyces sp. NRRL S-1868]
MTHSPAMLRPFGGSAEAWSEAVRQQAPQSTGAVTEPTEWGWVCWPGTAVEAHGAEPAPGTQPLEVAVLAPDWQRGWRARLLRSVWCPPLAPRRRPAPADAAPWAAGLAVWLAATSQLAPHLRGSTTLTVPLALALLAGWLTSRARPALRRATRARLRLVPGPGRLCTCTAAVGTYSRSQGVVGARRRTAQLVWDAAGIEIADRQFQRWHDVQDGIETLLARARDNAGFISALSPHPADPLCAFRPNTRPVTPSWRVKDWPREV